MLFKDNYPFKTKSDGHLYLVLLRNRIIRLIVRKVRQIDCAINRIRLYNYSEPCNQIKVTSLLGKSAKGNKSAKGKKKGKSPSPTPVPTTPVEESEEEKRKKVTAMRLREEYFAALYQEETGVKERLALIKQVLFLFYFYFLVITLHVYFFAKNTGANAQIAKVRKDQTYKPSSTMYSIFYFYMEILNVFVRHHLHYYFFGKFYNV